MNPTLALRCDLLADESLPSWVSRLAVLNCADTAHEFCLDMGFHFRTCPSGHPTALAKLGELTGLSHEVLHHASFITTWHDVSLRGEHLAPGLVRRSRIHVCPVCASEDIDAARTSGVPAPYGRILWQISAIRSCHRHGCALVEITHPRGLAMHDFALAMRGRQDDLLRLADRPQPRYASSLETYIANRLERAPTGSPWLDRLSLRVVIPLCELLGTLILFGSRTRYKTMSDRELHCAGDAGFEIARHGEVSIQNALLEVAKTYVHNPNGRQGPQAVFGAFYRCLWSHRQDKAFELVCDLVRRHIIATMPFGPGDHVLGHPVETRIVHSAVTASRDTGRNPKRLRRILAKAGLIGSDHADLNHHTVTFEAQTTLALFRTDADSLMLPDVAIRLNVSRFHAGEFADRGFIQPLFTERSRHNHRRRFYAPQTVDDFLARLTARAEPVETPDARRLSVLVAARRAGSDVADVIGLILQGQIDWIGRHEIETGIPSILVDVEEIRRKVETNPDGLSLNNVRLILKTSRTVARSLMNEGFLTYTVAKLATNRNPARLVDASSLAAFRATYVSIPELAEKSGRSYNIVQRVIAGVKPAIEKQRVGLTYYRRDEVSLIDENMANV